MGITLQQNLPKKPEEKKEKWSFKRLLPFHSTVSRITKTFSSPFDYLLSIAIIVLVICALFKVEVSWMFYFITIVLIFADVFERHQNITNKQE